MPRLKVVSTTKWEDGERWWTVENEDYPIIHYPLFKTKREAEEYVASGFYGMTVKGGKEWEKRNR